jgi:hypothetical protein
LPPRAAERASVWAYPGDVSKNGFQPAEGCQNGVSLRLPRDSCETVEAAWFLGLRCAHVRLVPHDSGSNTPSSGPSSTAGTAVRSGTGTSSRCSATETATALLHHPARSRRSSRGVRWPAG